MRVLIYALLFLVVLVSPAIAFASSDYVLPYPGFMPGSKLYLLKEIKNSVDRFWNFGNIGQYKYNLSLSDKYLVEAKTLFEYKQYLLGVESLKKSGKYFTEAKFSLKKARDGGIEVSNMEKVFASARDRHVEVLKDLSTLVPEKIQWVPENEPATDLYLQKEIESAILTLKQ